MFEDRDSSSPDEVTHYFCPVCGAERPEQIEILEEARITVCIGGSVTYQGNAYEDVEWSHTVHYHRAAEYEPTLYTRLLPLVLPEQIELALTTRTLS